MSPLAKIQLKQSDLKKQLSTLLENETRSESETAEMVAKTAELRSTEDELQTAILLQDPEPEETVKDTAQGREIRDIIGQASLVDYIEHAIDGKPLDGASAELQSAAFGDSKSALSIPIYL